MTDYGEIKVENILIDGVNKINHSFIKEILAPLLHSKSIFEINRKIEEINDRLLSLEIIKNPVGVSFDLVPTKKSLDLIPIDITIKVEEKNLTAKTGTELKQNEITFNAGCVIHNVFGKGEKLEASFEKGSNQKSPFTLLKKPFSHTCSIGSCYRILDQCGRGNLDSWKSTISHSLKYDSRNDPFLPDFGNFFMLSTDFNYFDYEQKWGIKQVLSSQLHYAMIKDLLTVSVGGNFGYIYPPVSSFQTISFVEDKLFLGGPTSLRLYPQRNIGPVSTIKTDNGDIRIPLGGNLSTAFGLSVTFPIVQSLKAVLRGHCWINMGSLISNFHLCDSYQGLSVGTGVIIKILNMARMEINCGRIFTFKQNNSHPGFNNCLLSSDYVRNSFVGPSFGIGVEFL